MYEYEFFELEIKETLHYLKDNSYDIKEASKIISNILSSFIKDLSFVYKLLSNLIKNKKKLNSTNSITKYLYNHILPFIKDEEYIFNDLEIAINLLKEDLMINFKNPISEIEELYLQAYNIVEKVESKNNKINKENLKISLLEFKNNLKNLKDLIDNYLKLLKVHK